MFLQLTLLSLFLQDFIYHNAVSALWMPDCSKTKHQDKPQCVCKNPKNWHMQVCQDFWKKPVIQKNVESRIVGGENAPANAYPWFARLVTRNGSWWGCGGTLIAKEYVLTAAHCVRSSDAGSLAVEIGAVCPYNSNNNNCGVPVQTLNAVSVVQHPQYNSNTLENDFAIIRLAGTANADPVPIDEGSFVDNYPSDKRGLWAIGFGSLSAGGNVSSQLRHVELAFVPRNTCNSAYSGGITNVMMCAADPGQDSCQGDSGGPLYDLQNNALVGVVSWGFGCADPRYPGVYAQVSSRINWIVSETCSSGPLPAYCPNAPTPTAPTPTAPTPTAPTPTAPTPTAPTPTAPTPTAPTPTAPTPTTSIPPIALKPCRRDDKNRFAMELTTDDYGSDTSVAVWKRKNNGSFGRLVYYADNFASAATYTLDKCLKVSGCYRVEIYDSYGDGLCCTYGQGSYQAYWDGSAIGSPPFEDGFVIDSDTFGNC